MDKPMNRIKEVLEEKGIKQTWLAEKLGKSFSIVNAYVCNRRQPSLENPLPDCEDIGGGCERVNHLCKKYGFLKFASKDGVYVKMTSKKVENIKENTMTTLTHDLTRHLRALRQTLSQDKKPIGFFISAGCPLSVPMPEGEWPLIPDMKQLSEYVSSQLQSKLPNTPSVFDRLIKELELNGQG